MMRFGALICVIVMVFAMRVSAQTTSDVVWVQIEARPSVGAATQRAETYAVDFANVRGFALSGGWYAIAIGPYTTADADEVLRSLKLSGRIPGDSYIAQSRNYGQQFWPPGEDILALGNLARLSDPPGLRQQDTFEATVAARPNTPVTLEGPDTETPAQARRAEFLLSLEERQTVQAALGWAGYYNAAIDGSFGRGTRNAMALWQADNGFEATGVLTSLQRAALLGDYNALLDGLDMTLVRDLKAGIEIRMPLGAVAFSGYDAPFAHYDATGDLEARVLLISQAGDRQTLASLYEVMQTLRIVPLQGPRQLRRDGFRILGQTDDFVSETEVFFSEGEIKGFTLLWPSGNETRRTRVFENMRASFTRRTGVLNETPEDFSEQHADLVAGLEVRRPVLARSGFYVDRTGTVVTSAATVEMCSRITLDETHDVTLASIDTENDVAVLKPQQTLAPPLVAEFSAVQPSLSSEIAVAGYSFEGQLGAPSVTFGTVSDLQGLTGETEVNRLSLPALPGDAGGPVFDQKGNVIGMLLPQQNGARRLPEDVRFALTVDALSRVLSDVGVALTKGQETASLAPQDITARGVGMTVLVSCWE